MRNKSYLTVVLLAAISASIFGVMLSGCGKEVSSPALEAAERLIESLDEIEKALPENENIDGIERAFLKSSESNEVKTQVQKQGK